MTTTGFPHTTRVGDFLVKGGKNPSSRQIIGAELLAIAALNARKPPNIGDNDVLQWGPTH
jgi:hypothetical protein